jgi:hypothetical protein
MSVSISSLLLAWSKPDYNIDDYFKDYNISVIEDTEITRFASQLKQHQQLARAFIIVYGTMGPIENTFPTFDALSTELRNVGCPCGENIHRQYNNMTGCN